MHMGDTLAQARAKLIEVRGGRRRGWSDPNGRWSEDGREGRSLKEQDAGQKKDKEAGN